MKGIKDAIEFKNVTFAYVPGKNVLNGINLKIPRGQKVALVGESGGGKTTICSMIPRMYDVSGGEIDIDGTDIRKYTLKSLRQPRTTSSSPDPSGITSPWGIPRSPTRTSSTRSRRPACGTL